MHHCTTHAARLLPTARRILRCWRSIAFARHPRLGVFEAISIIGRGGMGEVYRARDTRLARDVALKMLPDAKSSDLE